MTTIDDLRDALRIELHDEGGERWQDDVLDRHLERAARELAFVWPRELKSTLETTAGSRDLSLASLSGLVRVLAVEFPVALFPASFVQFTVFGDTLTMLTDQSPGDSQDVQVYWGGLHELDDQGSTLPPAAEEAVITGASGFAAVEWASFATNRANVAGPAAVDEYLRWGDRQLVRFQAMLSRLGDSARVRAGRFFVPAGEGLSRPVVRW